MCQSRVWNAQDEEEECLVMAVRTGLNTSLESMIRELICPSRLLSRRDPFIPVRSPAGQEDRLLLAILHVVTGSIKRPEQRMCDCNDNFPNSVYYRYLKLYMHSCLPDICICHVCVW